MREGEGEGGDDDRWLCTLLLQQGYRVEYSAAYDSFTQAPEGIIFYKTFSMLCLQKSLFYSTKN